MIGEGVSGEVGCDWYLGKLWWLGGLGIEFEFVGVVSRIVVWVGVLEGLFGGRGVDIDSRKCRKEFEEMVWKRNVEVKELVILKNSL